MDLIKKYLTPGTIGAVLSVAAVIAGAFGKGALSTFLTDPSTAQNILLVVGAIGTLWSGAAAGVGHVSA